MLGLVLSQCRGNKTRAQDTAGTCGAQQEPKAQRECDQLLSSCQVCAHGLMTFQVFGAKRKGWMITEWERVCREQCPGNEL